MELTVMTYNIAGGRDHRSPQRPVNPSAVSDVIRQYQPDVCGLNEVDFGLPRSGKIDMAHVIAQNVGQYHSFFARAVTWEPGQYGNGMITRRPLLSAESIPIPDPEDKSEPTYYETRCILNALVDFDGIPVRFLITHFGLAKAERQNAVATLLPLIDGSTDPLIVMGDFNLQPGDPILAPVLERLHDTFREFPDQSAPTFPSLPIIKDDGTREKSVKIDYLLTSRHFCTQEVIIPQAVASDHLPYVAKLILNERV